MLVSGLVLYNWNASFAARFTDIVLLATWMTLIAYAYAAAAEVVLFFRERELFRWVKLARDTVIAGLAFAYSVWAIWGSGEEWLAKGFMLLLFGIPVYIWMKWRQSRKPERVEMPVPPVPLAATNGKQKVLAGIELVKGDHDAQGHHHGSRRPRLPQLQRRSSATIRTPRSSPSRRPRSPASTTAATRPPWPDRGTRTGSRSGPSTSLST